MRFWIGIALLAGSWLFGLDYFYPARCFAWFITVAGGVALLAWPQQNSRRAEIQPDVLPKTTFSWPTVLPLLLLLPAVCFAAWPYRAAPLLIVIGLAIRLLPQRKAAVEQLARGLILSGIVLLIQSLALELYAAHTMRSHDLPYPLPDVLVWLIGLFGVDAAADGSTIVMHSMRQVHHLAATWDLLLDPATLLFFVGGATLILLQAFVPASSDSVTFSPTASVSHWSARMASLRRFTYLLVAWLPLRAMLLIGLYLHRVLRAAPDQPLHAMNHFFSPWTLLLLLLPPVLLAWRFVRVLPSDAAVSPAEDRVNDVGDTAPPSPSSFRLRPSALPTFLFALSIALFTAAIYWNPVAGRNQGRVKFVERHSHWAPTTKPYDTTWYVEPRLFGENSGHNYARVYRYLEQYYDLSRLLDNDKIDDETLAKCDVLVITVPTERYSPDELKAVARFVEQGGGLLLLGDHTNQQGSSTALNDIARPLGFVFRDDLLLGFGNSPDNQPYKHPTIPHPAVQRVPPVDLADSCSINPGSSRGRTVIAGSGLWSMAADYHHEDYRPVPQHGPEMRFGPFVQAWAAWHGRGRVLAFGNATIFANSCLGQPGKSELMLGMVEWLNHRSPWLDPRPWLSLLALASLAAAIWKMRSDCRAAAATAASTESADGLPTGAVVGLPSSAEASIPSVPQQSPLLLLLAAGCFAWAITSWAIVGVHRWSLPNPPRIHPQREVVIERMFSTVPLSQGVRRSGKDDGYGMLEQWLARLDCTTARREGREMFAGDVLVSICPSRAVPEKVRNQIADYVAQGGKLVVIDSPENMNSTANSLLWPFGLSVHPDKKRQGRLTAGFKTSAVAIDAACEVLGGEPVAAIGTHPVAAFARHGKGSVLAIGFGSLWNDTRMGGLSSTEPNATVRGRYDVLFGLLRPFFGGKPLPPASLKEAGDSDDSLLREIGPAKL